MCAGKGPAAPSIVESQLDNDLSDEYSVLDKEGVTAMEGDDVHCGQGGGRGVHYAEG